MSDNDRRALFVLGKAVRMARHQRAWSQRELEERSGVDQTTISRMERGLAWGTAIVRFAHVAWALAQAMPLGGCPHQHRCAWSLRWAAVLKEVAPMFPETHDSAQDRSIELFERQLREEH